MSAANAANAAWAGRNDEGGLEDSRDKRDCLTECLTPRLVKDSLASYSLPYKAIITAEVVPPPTRKLSLEKFLAHLHLEGLISDSILKIYLFCHARRASYYDYIRIGYSRSYHNGRFHDGEWRCPEDWWTGPGQLCDRGAGLSA